MNIKQAIYNTINSTDKPTIASRIFDISIISLIILNVISMIIATFDIPEWLNIVLQYIETISVIIFTIEYLLRIYVADLMYPELTPFRARLKYLRSFMALVDLMAILPFYLPFVMLDLRAVRLLRVGRLLRLLKLSRYTNALKNIFEVFRIRKNELISSTLVILILMLIMALIVFNAEHEVQPEAFDNLFSSIWWTVVTITTVGYGDIYPVTPLGRLSCSLFALLGMALLTVPTGIISSGFIELYNARKDRMEKRKRKRKKKRGGEEETIPEETAEAVLPEDPSDAVRISETTDEDEKCYCPYCGKKIK